MTNLEKPLGEIIANALGEILADGEWHRVSEIHHSIRMLGGNSSLDRIRVFIILEEKGQIEYSKIDRISYMKAVVTQ